MVWLDHGEVEYIRTTLKNTNAGTTAWLTLQSQSALAPARG
jgi:hypothetical protein